LAENDAELAIVMGHEIGHVIARHGAERMSEALVIASVGALGSAVVEAKTEDQRMRQLYEVAYGGGTTLLRVLPHSRRNESEADRMGAIYAARAGYDPRASISFWQKMAAQKRAGDAKAAGGPSTLESLLSTHPADEKRIADLRALMPQVMPIYEKSRAAGGN
jgi:predicted Zn-dependent protease